MKGSHTCPKCRHRKIWLVPTVELAREIKRTFDAATLARLGLGGMREVTARDPVMGFDAYVCAVASPSTTRRHGKTSNGSEP
jgi:hypothetical protein